MVEFIAAQSVGEKNATKFLYFTEAKLVLF